MENLLAVSPLGVAVQEILTLLKTLHKVLEKLVLFACLWTYRMGLTLIICFVTRISGEQLRDVAHRKAMVVH